MTGVPPFPRPGLILIPLFLLAFGPLSPGAGEAASRIVREGPDGFTLRITLPEPTRDEVLLEGARYARVTLPDYFTAGGEPIGHPDLPQRGYPFGLPDGVTARVTGVRVVERMQFRDAPPLPVPEVAIGPGDVPAQEVRYRPAPGAYAGGGVTPTEWATLGPVFGWRHQRVQSLIVHPVRVRPASGEYEAVRELEVTVSFETAERAPRPAVGRRPVFRDAPGWDESQSRILVNPTSARSFRTRSSAGVRASALQPGENAVRVRVGTPGLVRFSYQTLAGHGFPAGTAIGDVRVEERDFNVSLSDPYIRNNVPRRVEDANGNGTFDAGDYVWFYGVDFATRYPLAPLFRKRYSYFFTYWITHTGGPGLEFTDDGGFPQDSTYVAVTNFPQVAHGEDDLIYINDPPDAGSSLFPVSSALYWLGPTETALTHDIPVDEIDTAGQFTVTGRWQGKETSFVSAEHIVSIAVNGNPVIEDARFFNRNALEQTSAPRPSAGILREGSNRVSVTGRTSQATNRTGSMFDWYEITYDRTLVSRNDRLLLETGAYSGDLEYVVRGFGSADIRVLDVTNPALPFLMSTEVIDQGGTWDVRFRTTVSPVQKRRFLATRTGVWDGPPPTAREFPPDLDAEVGSGFERDLVAAGAGSDYILITHPDFRDAWGDLIAHRESQGHRVFLCDVIEIYDQFAGGNKTPQAIQRFLTAAFRTWDPAPSFLLLGGDACEDYRKDTPLARIDWVPTMMHHANVGGPTGLELAGTDNWYVAFLREGDPDFDVIPEMHVARLPVNNAAEIQQQTDKIIRFETEDPSAAWRNRGFLLADDQYSTSINFNAGYCWSPSEVAFRSGSQTVCDSIAGLGGYTDFECDIFFLNEYLDSVDVAYRDPPQGVGGDCPKTPLGVAALGSTVNYTRANVTPRFIDRLNEGWLFWQYTGHANRFQITTEALISEQGSTGTLNDLRNATRPFLFFGFACHLLEFEHARESADGPAIGEKLLMDPDGGAIASFASTGYELLSTQFDIHTWTTRPFFWNLPRDPETGRPRRLLMETINRGIVGLALENPTPDWYPQMLRTYQTLGDPALRIDMYAPQFSVSLDGVDWEEGMDLEADSFSDSLGVTVLIHEDVDLENGSIRVLDDGNPLPPERLTVTPPAAGTEGLQVYRLSFSTALRLGSYDLVVESRDWRGSLSQVQLPVRFETRFRADGQALDPGGNNLVDTRAEFTIEVDSPVPMAETAFELRVDGTPVDAVWSPLGDDNRTWTAEYTGEWETGAHELELVTSDPVGGTVERSVAFEVSAEPLTLLQAYFYPNPYESAELGPPSLVYELNRSAARARLVVYTVRGRRVLGTDLPAFPGRNAFRWDLRDETGDEVANGVYLFLLTLEDGGKTVERLERVVVSR